MPRFHFHTEDGRCYPDEDGIELPTFEAARTQAVIVLGEVLKEQPELFLEHDCLRITVTDEDQLTLLTLDASATVSPAARALGLQPH